MNWLRNLVLICAALTTMSVLAETDVKNGGDQYADTFRDMAWEIVGSLKADGIPYVDVSDLEKQIPKTVITSSAEQLYADDPVTGKKEAVSFTNEPNAVPPRITIYRNDWDNWPRERLFERYFFVLHELLGVMHPEDRLFDYQLKVSRGLDRSQLCYRNPIIRDYLEKVNKKSCWRFTRDDMRWQPWLDLPYGYEYEKYEGTSLKEIKPLIDRDFVYLEKLEGIKIHKAQIGPSGFREISLLPALEHLDLNGGSFSGFPEGINWNFGKLKFVHLSENTLIDLKDAMFEGLGTVHRIVFYRNEIRRMGERVFAGMKNLDAVVFIGEKIENWGPESFEGLEGLPMLKYAGRTEWENNSTTLHGKPIQKIGARAFQGFGGQIKYPKEIQQDFHDTKGKSTLQLVIWNSENSSIDPDFLKGMNPVEELSLQFTHVKRIPVSALSGLPPQTKKLTLYSDSGEDLTSYVVGLSEEFLCKEDRGYKYKQICTRHSK